jgi:hypothetical protein
MAQPSPLYSLTGAELLQTLGGRAAEDLGSWSSGNFIAKSFVHRRFPSDGNPPDIA